MSDDLLRLEADPTLPESTGWRPMDLVSCDWAMARVAELQRVRADNDDAERAAIERVRARMAPVNARIDKAINYLLGVVEAFAQANRERLIPGKKKTRDLPNGSISFRKQGGRLVVEDAKALAEWALSEEFETEGVKLTRTKVEVAPDVEAIRKYAATAREGGLLIPPGMKWEDETETVLVKATGSELLTTTTEEE